MADRRAVPLTCQDSREGSKQIGRVLVNRNQEILEIYIDDSVIAKKLIAAVSDGSYNIDIPNEKS